MCSQVDKDNHMEAREGRWNGLDSNSEAKSSQQTEILRRTSIFENLKDAKWCLPGKCFMV